MNKIGFGFFFILFILLVSQMVVETEGNSCKSKSSQFKGICLSNKKCARVCHLEGFLEGGKCKGKLLKYCSCKKSIC
ncbi:unnamed protein product [Lathyrus oleraceus]